MIEQETATIRVEPKMSFREAVRILNIEDFGERIFHSNSHGELFHLVDYIAIASIPGEKEWFRPWFLQIVDQAKFWSRPESCFQHIFRLLKEQKEKMEP